MWYLLNTIFYEKDKTTSVVLVRLCDCVYSNMVSGGLRVADALFSHHSLTGHTWSFFQ